MIIYGDGLLFWGNGRRNRTSRVWGEGGKGYTYDIRNNGSGYVNAGECRPVIYVKVIWAEPCYMWSCVQQACVCVPPSLSTYRRTHMTHTYTHSPHTHKTIINNKNIASRDSSPGCYDPLGKSAINVYSKSATRWQTRRENHQRRLLRNPVALVAAHRARWVNDRWVWGDKAACLDTSLNSPDPRDAAPPYAVYRPSLQIVAGTRGGHRAKPLLYSTWRVSAWLYGGDH